MTATKTDVSHPDRPRVARRRKLIGLAFMAPPMTLFMVFAVAEGIGVAPGWWSHVLQLAAGVLLAVAAWVRPRIGGLLLILAGTLPAVFMLLQADSDGVSNLSAIALVFLPLVIAGVFFTRAGNTLKELASHQ